MKDQSLIIPQSQRAASKQPLDGRIRFNTIEAAIQEAYDGAIFYIVSLAEWYKFKLNAQGVLVYFADSAIDASEFATKNELNNKADKTLASESAAGLLSDTYFRKIRDIKETDITKVRASATNGNIRINDVEVIVYTRPNTATDRPVSDAEKAAWNGKADGVHVHNNYSPTTHNHDNVYAPKEHEHQVWDAVLGRFREKYVLANSQGGGGDATSLSGLALNNNATGDVANDAIWSANKVLGVVNAKVSELATGLAWKASVNTYADIATTYPNPEDGWTTIAIDTDKTWRFNGSTWEDISVTIIPLATPLVDGKMSAADKAKLDGIAEGANNYTHPASHLASMITEETDKLFMTAAERAYIGQNTGTINGTYTKVAADYPENKIIVERVIGTNVGLGTSASYIMNGILITYVASGRAYTSQIFVSTLNTMYTRFATSGAWAAWRTNYNDANVGMASGSAFGFMTATDKTKLDGVATGATNTPLGSTNPAALGVAAPGVSTSAAREDHVHALPSAATQSAAGLMSTTDKTKLDGVATGATNTPLGSTNPAALGVAAPGVSTSAAREDHVHALPSAATQSAAGLMSTTDKTKLDGVATGATNTPLGSTNPAALGVAAPGVSTSAAREDHVHALPSAATQSAAGLMSAADKTKLDGVGVTTTLSFDFTNKSTSFGTTVLNGRKTGKINYLTGIVRITSNYASSPQLVGKINSYVSPGHTVYFPVNVKQTQEGSTGYIDTSGNIYLYWGVSNANDNYAFNVMWIEA